MPTVALKHVKPRNKPGKKVADFSRTTLPRSVGKGAEDYECIEEKSAPRGVLMASSHHPLGRSIGLAMGGFTPLPNRLRAKMRYVSIVSLGSGVTPGLNVFSANGLYDPDITGTGHQPRGFDQLIALYDHYVVTKSVCHVQFTGGITFQVGGVQLQANSTAQSDYIDYAEQARCTYALTPMFYNNSGGCPEPPMHSVTFEAQEFMGIPDPLTATKLQGTVSANPADQAFFHVWQQHIDGSSAASQSALVTIVYDVTFIEPVPVASS